MGIPFHSSLLAECFPGWQLSAAEDFTSLGPSRAALRRQRRGNQEGSWLSRDYVGIVADGDRTAFSMRKNSGRAKSLRREGKERGPNSNPGQRHEQEEAVVGVTATRSHRRTRVLATAYWICTLSSYCP